MPSINWGGDETTAPFTSELDETSGNLVLAEDNDGNTVLLEWDGTTWQFRGPIDMNGEDVSGVGTLTATDVVADSVNTESATIGGASLDRLLKIEDTDSQSGDGSQQNLTLTPESPADDAKYIVSLTRQSDWLVDSGTIEVTIPENGDGDYDYFDETATEQQGQDSWRILNLSSGVRIFGTELVITNSTRCSFNHNFAAADLTGVDGFAREGTVRQPGDLDNITISYPSRSIRDYGAVLYRVVES